MARNRAPSPSPSGFSPISLLLFCSPFPSSPSLSSCGDPISPPPSPSSAAGTCIKPSTTAFNSLPSSINHQAPLTLFPLRRRDPNAITLLSSFHRRRPPFSLSGLPSFSMNHTAAVCLPPLRPSPSTSSATTDHPTERHHRHRRPPLPTAVRTFPMLLCFFLSVAERHCRPLSFRFGHQDRTPSSPPYFLFIFFVSAEHHPSPLPPPPPSPTTPPHPPASPLLSLSFSFVRSTIRLPPLHLSSSISALISSAEHRWPPPSPSSPLYPHLSHHDCHHPCFPSSFPWCCRHLSAPSTAGFSPSSPSSAAVAPCSLFTLPSPLPFSLFGLRLAPPSSPIFLSAMIFFFP